MIYHLITNQVLRARMSLVPVLVIQQEAEVAEVPTLIHEKGLQPHELVTLAQVTKFQIGQTLMLDAHAVCSGMAPQHRND